jgi:hypothetical protein
MTATARKIGTNVGRGIGKVGGFAWNGACRIAVATGDFGEGVIAGTEQGWDEAMVKETARKAAAKAAMLAYLAEQGVATPMAVTAAPEVVVAKRKAAAA